MRVLTGSVADDKGAAGGVSKSAFVTQNADRLGEHYFKCRSGGFLFGKTACEERRHLLRKEKMK